MTIPNEAVEAAVEAHCEGTMRAALEAAAPHIQAQALRDAAAIFHGRLPDGTGNGRAYNSYQVADMLRARAAALEGK